MSKLNEKQKAFADYYIESLNATESYKKAYGVENQSTAEVVHSIVRRAGLDLLKSFAFCSWL